MGLLNNPQTIIAIVPALLIALTFHEYAHARVAYVYGDRTALMSGRMTLNPISHLDPIGTLMILLVGFGWARPVPINPSMFRDLRGGLLWVSLAGPLTNFAMGFLAMLLLAFLLSVGIIGGGTVGELFLLFMIVLIQLNIILGLFNLLPIPPLDGSKILASQLPSSSMGLYRQIEAYAPLILIFLLVFGVLGAILWPLAGLIVSIFDVIVSTVTGISIAPYLMF